MPKVFISYRRSDAREEAVRLADQLIEEFGAASVFFDTDSLVPGDLFPAEIEADIRTSTHVLVVIGPGWLTASPETGQPRIFDTGDWVHREVSLALAQDKTVIPVLVQNAEMPGQTELPLDIRRLVKKNAVSLRPGTFRGDLDGLSHRMRDRSALVAAGIVFATAALSGLVFFFVDSLIQFSRQTFEMIWTMSGVIQEIAADDLSAEAASQLKEMDTEIERTQNSEGFRAGFQAVQLLLLSTIYGMLAYGGLMAARGYTNIKRDRIFPAAALATTFFFLATVIVDVFEKALFPPGPDEEAELFLVFFGETPELFSYAAFVLGIMLVLKRQIRFSSFDITLVTGFTVIGVAVSHVLVPQLYSVTLSICGENVTATCYSIPFLFQHILRFVVPMLLACFVSHWRFSLAKVAAVSLALTILSCLGLLGIVLVERMFFPDSTILENLHAVEVVFFATVAFLLARFHIKTTAAIKQPKLDQEVVRNAS